VAALFVQKGWDNVVMLTGGIKHFAEKYPDRTVGQGKLPVSGAGSRAPTGASSRGGSGSVSQRSSMPGSSRGNSAAVRGVDLAGAPAPRSRLSGGSSASGGSVGSALAPGSSRHVERPLAVPPQRSEPNMYAAAAVASAAPLSAPLQQMSATSLGFIAPDTAYDRESPRAALWRSQAELASAEAAAVRAAAARHERNSFVSPLSPSSASTSTRGAASGRVPVGSRGLGGAPVAARAFR
jgi:hypothetical protein